MHRVVHAFDGVRAFLQDLSPVAKLFFYTHHAPQVTRFCLALKVPHRPQSGWGYRTLRRLHDIPVPSQVSREEFVVTSW